MRNKTPSQLPNPQEDNELPARLIHSNSDPDMESSEYCSFKDQA